MNLIKRKNPWFPVLADDFLSDDWNLNVPSFTTSFPAVNIKESDTQFSIELAIPGKKKDDFAIEVDQGLLSIAAEEKKDKTTEDGKFTRREFNYNAFRRAFSLPKSVENTKIDAAYKDGVLTVTLPKKKEAQPQPKKLIAIR